jgi:hypothetical protein
VVVVTTLLVLVVDTTIPVDVSVEVEVEVGLEAVVDEVVNVVVELEHDDKIKDTESRQVRTTPIIFLFI